MLYIKDDGDYSNTPVKVGRIYLNNEWKDLYRKVYTGNTPTTSGDTLFTDGILYNMIYMTGHVLNTGNSKLTLPGYYVSATDHMTMHPQGPNMKMVMGNTNVLGNRPYVCIVYYTV